MVTFYLLNCEACKPRIEKYGPVASRSRRKVKTPVFLSKDVITDVAFLSDSEDTSDDDSVDGDDEEVCALSLACALRAWQKLPCNNKLYCIKSKILQYNLRSR